MKQLLDVFRHTTKAKAALLWAAAAVLILSTATITINTVGAASCVPPATDYGTVATTVNIPAQSTYRVWSHLKGASTNDTYMLEIDGKDCFNVGGSGLSANQWQWVSHRDGNSASKTDIALSQGSHTLKLIGNKAGVKIDRLAFAADLTCVPSGDGSNCNTPSDSTAPVVDLTAPQASTPVSGTVVMSATASDNTSVSKVEFSVNGSVISTDTSAPYSANWNTTTYANGEYTVGVEAYDAAGNSAQDSYKVTVQNGDKQAPTIPGNVSATATAHNKVTIKWQASSDNVGVKGYTLFKDGIPVATLGAVTSHIDTTVNANTTYRYRVQAFDTAGNTSATSSEVTVKTPVIADTQPPSAPTSLKAAAASSSQINLSWKASSDNIGVVAYDVYRATGSSQAAKVTSVTGTSFGDANLKADTAYSYYIKARDGAGNQSAASATANARTAKTPQAKARVSGTITNAKTGRPIAHAIVMVKHNKRTYVYIADHKGRYATRTFEKGQYTLTYRAWGYKSTTAKVTVNNSPVTKNVALQRR